MSSFSCPECKGPTTVKDSRSCAAGASIRRRRLCLTCEARFSTCEIVGRVGDDEEGAANLDRIVEIVGALGRLKPEEGRLVLILAKRLAGDEFTWRAGLERAA